MIYAELIPDGRWASGELTRGEANIDDASRKVAAVFRASVPQDADCRGNPKVLRRMLSHSIWAKCLSRKFATKSACIALSFAMNPAPVGADEGIS